MVDIPCLISNRIKEWLHSTHILVFTLTTVLWLFAKTMFYTKDLWVICIAITLKSILNSCLSVYTRWVLYWGELFAHQSTDNYSYNGFNHYTDNDCNNYSHNDTNSDDDFDHNSDNDFDHNSDDSNNNFRALLRAQHRRH